MGKYMRKAKVTGEVAVMEVVAQSTIGVRTRAKTLALQRLQKISSSPTTTTSTTAAASTDTDNNNNNNNSGGTSYFQLRSRKLERPPFIVVDSSSSKKQTQAKEVVCKKNPNPKLRTSPRFVVGTVNSGSVGSVNLSCSKNNDENERIHEKKKKNYDDLCLEASFGENVLDIEERDRSTRETTPCSLIRDPDTIRTPGSSTRPTTLSNRRMRNPMRGNIPTTREMDEFFANAEQQQQRFFTEKYNFDPVNDLPLPGRYEWVSVDL